MFHSLPNTARPCSRSYVLLTLLLFLYLAPASGQNTGRWYEQDYSGDPAEARHESGFVKIGAKFYLIGGRGTKTVQEYDPDTGVIRNTNTSTSNIHHFQAVEYQGKAYLIGAMRGNFPSEDPLENVLIYDPVADELTTGPAIPAGRRRGGAGVVEYDDKFYLIAGNRNGHSAFMEDGVTPANVPWLDVFDPATGSWTALTDAPHSRDHFYAAEKDGKIYVAAGRRSRVGTPDGTWKDTEAAVDVFDIATNTWLTGSARVDDLPTERAGAPVAILGNELIVLGGEIDNNPPDNLALATTEAMDLTTGTWRQLDGMVTGRHGTQAVVYKNDLYVAAGSRTRGGGEIRRGGNYVEAFSFDGTPGSSPGYPDWRKIGNGPSQRAESQTIVYQGEMYCFFGFRMGNLITTDVSKFNPVTKTWKTVARAPVGADGQTLAVTHYGAALVDDKVWIVGGRLRDHPGPVTDRVWIFDLATSAFTAGPTLPFPAGGGALARIGDKLHYVGGFDPQAEGDSDAHLVFDLNEPATGWQDYSDRSPMPLARNHFGATVYNGKLYTIGGQNGHDGPGAGVNVPYVHAYDAATDTWERLSDMPYNQSHMEGSTFNIDGDIIALGGESGGFKSLRYDIANDTWERDADLALPLPLIGPNARVFDETVYVSGGGAPSTFRAVDTTWAKDFPRAPTQALSFNVDNLRLRLSEGKTSVTEVILANLNGEASTPYQLNTTDFPTWLSANRTTGISRESFVAVGLTVNTTGLAPGDYSFTLRALANGYSPAALPITITVGGDGAGSKTRFTLEAECALIGSNFVTEAVTGASNGSVVYNRDGYSTGNPPADIPANRVRFIIDNAVPGSYDLFARSRGDMTSFDSYWVRVNDGRWVLWFYRNDDPSGLVWNEVRDRPIGLTAGVNTIDFAYREANTWLDKIHLNQTGVIPTGVFTVGTNCDVDPPTGVTSFVLEAECARVGTNFITEPNGAASNSSVVYGNNGYSTSGPPADVAANRVRFTVEGAEAGAFNLYARSRGDNSSFDSFWVRVNGGQWALWFYRNDDPSGLVWNEVTGSPITLTGGTNTIDFAYREPNTWLDKIALNKTASQPSGIGAPATNCDVAPPTDESFTLEAECAQVGSSFATTASGTASNGSYVFGNNGYAARNAPTDVPANRVRFSVNAAAAGDFDMYARVRGDGANFDSFWVRVNGGQWVLWFYRATDPSGLVWVDVATVPVSLTAGANTIDFAYREPNTWLDKIYVSNSGSIPSGRGGAATNCPAALAKSGIVTTEPAKSASTDAAGADGPPKHLELGALTVFPNPTADYLNFTVDNAYEGAVEAYVISIDGSLVRRADFRKEAGSFTGSVQMYDLPAGTYLLRLVSDTQVQQARFVKWGER